jgi:hypothetical protein
MPESLSWLRPREFIQGLPYGRGRIAAVIAGDRGAERFDMSATLQSNRRDDRRVARNRFDRRSGLVAGQKDLGEPAIAEISGAAREAKSSVL